MAKKLACQQTFHKGGSEWLTQTRWRLRNIVGGVRVFDDALGTVTDYIINEDWGV